MPADKAEHGLSANKAGERSKGLLALPVAVDGKKRPKIKMESRPISRVLFPPCGVWQSFL